MIVQYLLHSLQLFPEKKMKREIRIRTQITVPKWIQFIVKSRAWHVKLWCFLRGLYCAITDSAWHFMSGSPFCVLWKIPHTHWCVNHASGVRTADWTLNVKPSQIKSNQSICYLTQKSSNSSCRLEYRNRKHFSWSSCEKRVPCVQDVLSTYYHAAPKYAIWVAAWWWFLIDLNHRCVLISILHGLRTWLFRI